MSRSSKSISVSKMALLAGTKEKIARNFMHKIRESMASSENFPMDDLVQVDEFVINEQEQGKLGRSYDSKKKKAITAVQLTEQGKVKRMYIQKLEIFQHNHYNIYL